MTDRESELLPLAHLLDYPLAEVTAALPGNWHVDDCSEGPSDGGRWVRYEEWGAAAVVEVHRDADDVQILVGMAKVFWDGPGSPVVALGYPEWVVDDDFVGLGGPGPLELLALAVERCVAAKGALLLSCQHCGNAMAPEDSLSLGCCYGCGSSVYGIVY